jgi:cysteine-rich repeat protein
LCPDTCLQCTSATTCTQCINGSYILINASCVVDCSSISNCIDCDLGPICKNCSSYYQLSSNSCVSICGDGVLLSGEQCDDNNTDSNDGCSSSCTLET